MPDETYIVSGTSLSATADAIRAKGGTSAAIEYGSNGFATAIAALPSGGGGGGTYQAKTNIDPTTSSQTITADSGYDALSSVQINAMPSGTAGTPTATKGTVSNHSISVTPSVTNTTGYITGSTKTGTAVTVSASELVSGSETKTANGTYDVTNLASLIVNVSGGVSNFVTGTFTGTTSGQTLDVNVNYTGTGYPIMIFVVPTGGIDGNSTFSSLIKRYAIAHLSIYKLYASSTPTYAMTGSENQYSVCSMYKNSSSAANSYTRTSATNTVITYGNSASPSGAVQSLLFRNNKKFSVLIQQNSNGFAANIEYTYYIMYST